MFLSLCTHIRVEPAPDSATHPNPPRSAPLSGHGHSHMHGLSQDHSSTVSSIRDVSWVQSVSNIWSSDIWSDQLHGLNISDISDIYCSFKEKSDIFYNPECLLLSGTFWLSWLWACMPSLRAWPSDWGMMKRESGSSLPPSARTSLSCPSASGSSWDGFICRVRRIFGQFSQTVIS